MPTYTVLIEILKANEIRGHSHYTKSKLIDLLIKRGQILEKYDSNKQVKARKDIEPKNYFLKQIRSNPKKVEVHDYKAALALDQNPEVIGMCNGKVWRSSYAIKTLTESESF